MCSPSKNTIRKETAVNVALQADGTTEITSLRDTQDIGEGASRVNFFPASSNQSDVRANYQHPLPYQHAIPSIAVNATKGAIRSTDLTAVDVYGILDELREAQLVITANNGDTVIERVPLRKVMNLEEAHVEAYIAADATDTVAEAIEQYVLHLPAGGYYDLDQPFVLQAGDDYAAELRFENGDAFPAEAAYNGKALGLEIEMKAVVPAPEEE